MRIYDEVVARGSNSPHGVWGPTSCAAENVQTALIKDTNDNTALNIGAVSNAVNDLSVNNKAAGASLDVTLTPNGSGSARVYAGTGQHAKIQGSGVDADVNLELNTQGAGVVRANNVPVVTTTGTQDLSNKTLMAPQIINNADLYVYTALAAGLTLNAPSADATPTDGEQIQFRIKDNGSSRSLTWDSIYRALGTTIPSATTSGKWLLVTTVYNAGDTKWDAVDVKQEA